MAVVFNVDNWRLKYPALSDKFTDDQLQIYFDIASTVLLDNTSKSIVKDETVRAMLYDMLVCHLATLADRGSTITGSLTSASEGGVSASFSVPTSSDDISSWYKQTQCGWAYWLYMLQYRRGGIYLAYKGKY